MTSDCVYYEPNGLLRTLSRFKERLVSLDAEEKLKMRMKVLATIKPLADAMLSPDEFEEMTKSRGCKPIGAVEDVVRNTANVLKEVLKIYNSNAENLMQKLHKIAHSCPSSQNQLSVVEDQEEEEETKMDFPKPNENESKANYGKDFARGDHPSRSGATYCEAVERPQRQPKRWNGPGMRMLPPLYGESLHHHKKFVDVSEDWETADWVNKEKVFSFEKHDDAVTATSNRSSGSNTFLPSAESVPVYVPKENERKITEQEKKFTAVAEKYQIYERFFTVRDKIILWFRFQRPGSSKEETVFLVFYNGSYYIWYDYLISNFAGNWKSELLFKFKKPNLKLLTDPINSDDVKSKLASMVGNRLEDLTLTTLRNFDLLRGLDDDLAAVLEVFYYNWRNPGFKIKFVK